MIFNSSEFLLFLPVVFIIYWLLQKKSLVYQNVLILVASYVFYGWWDYRFLSLIAFSTLVDFFLGRKIEEEKHQGKKKAFLFASLGMNLGLLGFFKYYNFFVSSFEDMLMNMGFQVDTWTLNIILPVGISFYTFQTLSYSIDIYKGKIKHTNDLISFASFVAFFPQLVAGPIERASHLLPQFTQRRKFETANAIHGVNLIVYGMFKKVVIADRLAIYVNSVFDNIEQANSWSLILAVVFFSFQIYCDFSGYSLIARGIAKLFGFEIMTNFNKPYLASSLPDFWRRWHISLSTWFRDYVYIPLGGNRVSTIRNYSNIMVVFLVSGLWHGANWTFIVWGFIHGIFQVVYLTYLKIARGFTRQPFPLRILSTLFVYFIVCVAWIFFRAQSIDEAFFFIQEILAADFSYNLTQLCAEKGPLNLVLSAAVIALLFLSYALPKNLKFEKINHSLALNTVLILIIITIGIHGEAAFIYFQF